MPMTVQCGSQPLQGAVRAGAFLAAVLLPLLAHSAAVERPAVIVSTVLITPPGERTDDPAAAEAAVAEALEEVAADMELRANSVHCATDREANRSTSSRRSWSLPAA